MKTRRRRRKVEAAEEFFAEQNHKGFFFFYPPRGKQVKAAWKLIRGRITAAAGPEPLSLSGEVNKVLGGSLL